MSSWRRSREGITIIAVALASTGCSIPFPVLRNAGPFEVPVNAAHAPLEKGRRVVVVAQAPRGCLFLGLATGVGGRENQYEGTADVRYREFRREAVVALRNAVGRVGGTHVRVDAEVIVSVREGVTHVLLRGPALRCRR
ncbi:MAG: hypothetical protein AAGN82_00405 [Myxococcota bacterium]